MTIAFFDFDGTVITGDSGLICAWPTMRAGHLPAPVVASFVGRYLLYKAGLGTRHAMQRVGFACFRGHTLDTLRSRTSDLSSSHLSRKISPAMMAAIAHHRARGDKLYILTGAAHFFAEPLGRELGFDAVYGTQVEMADTLCTGRVDGEILDGDQKLRLANRLAEEAGHSLAECVFYSDHVADLPLLEAVGRPVCVGPHSKLRRIAVERGWPIVEHHDEQRPRELLQVGTG